MLSRRRILHVAALALAGGIRPVLAQPARWPTGPIKIIVPYPPGGSTDVAARVIGQVLQESLGQPVVIDNRAGAGGNIGMEAGARAPADGYTLSVATTAHAINMTLFRQLNYDTIKSFAPIALMMEVPLLVTVHPSLPAKTIGELIAIAKGKNLNYGSSGNGQSTHMAAELFSSMAGVKMTHVPYRGSAPAMNDHIAGHVQVMFDTALSALPHVQSGALRALAVTSRERIAPLPEVPTVASSGLAGYEVTAWNGLMAPAGTPAAIVEQLNREIVKALGSNLVKERFAALAAAGRATTVAEYSDYVRAEVEKWAQVVRQSGAKID